MSPDGFSAGDPSAPAASALWQRTRYAFDDEGRLAGTTQVSVDRSGGGPVLGPSLMGQVFYDGDGRVIATSSPSGLWTKTVYDGAGRAIDVFQTDGAGGADAATLWRADGPGALVGLDHVFGQTEVTYDAAGNAILTIRKDRLAEDTTSTGPLGDANGQFGDTEGSVSRTSYVARYYDAANRLTDTVDVGTNGDTVWRRPSVVPPSNAATLVTHMAYDAAGWVKDVIDPAGTWTDYQYDALGNVKREVDNYNNTLALGVDPDVNKVTAYTYNGDNEVTSVAVNNVIPAMGAQAQSNSVQQTTYAYGGRSIDNSLLSSVTHVGVNPTLYSYDNLGDVTKEQDQAGNVHNYEFDSLGRRISDFVSTFGPGVDTKIQALVTAYDVLDRPVLLTSEGPGSPGGAFANFNQVTNQYDALGNLTIQYQDHDGSFAVPASNSSGGSGLASVRYSYDSANAWRLSQITYPDSRLVSYGYTASALDNAINRVDSVSDGASITSLAADEQYGYLGLQTIVQRQRPQAGQPSLSVGLNSFGRVQSWKWQNGSVLVDGYSYAYNGVGQVTNANNLAWGVATFYGYDKLGHLAFNSRGAITFASASPGGDGNTVAVTPASWQNDSLGSRYGFPYGSSYAPAGEPRKVIPPAATSSASTITLTIEARSPLTHGTDWSKSTAPKPPSRPVPGRFHMMPLGGESDP